MNTQKKFWAIFAIFTFGLTLSGLWLIHPARAAGPWYVAPGGDDGDDCLSPATPCETINGAIGKATAGDTVFVAVGTYTGTDFQVVSINKDITLSGGWNLSFTTQDGMSTIDGETVRRGIGTDYTAFIEKFIVQNGYSGNSGGIYNSGVLSVADSIIRNNVSDNGGGIYNYTSGTIILTDTQIISNSTFTGHGGGIQNYGTMTLISSTVSENSVPDIYGGGLSNRGVITLISSTVSNNTGSGIWNWGEGSLTLLNSAVSNNDVGGIISMNTITLTDSTVSENAGDYGGIFIFLGAPFASATLNDSFVISNTISAGGGGIAFYSNGTLTLNNTIVSGNATEIGAGGSGGGIISGGTMIINNSTISHNTADSYGGGINNGGPLIINNSTINGNSTRDPFGSGGGGIYNVGPLTLNNSTVSGNVSQFKGGGIITFRPMTMTNSTISGNSAQMGGGIDTISGTLIMQNSLLAGNTSSGTGPDCYGTLNSQGYNLIQDTTGCTITGDTTGNLTGVDPLLGPLQDNGGPTLTHALLYNSPAIDAGNPATPGSGGNACEAIDQRGVVRPQFTACDIGAFELELPEVQFSSSTFSVNEDAGTATITITLSAVSPFTATVDYDTSDGTATAGSDYAPSTGTLTFAPGVLTQTITVPITDDALDEEDETLTLTLSNPVNAVLGTPTSATLTIVDDDEVIEFKVHLPLILK